MGETAMNKLALILILIFAGALSACNTTRGFGEDVAATGEGIQKVAEDTEEELEEATD
jgi:predicted small secreted protein